MSDGQHDRMTAIIIDLQKRVYALERELQEMKVVRKGRKP